MRGHRANDRRSPPPSSNRTWRFPPSGSRQERLFRTAFTTSSTPCALLLFGVPAQLLSQFPEFWRQHGLPKGDFRFRVFCGGDFHPNQLRFPLTRLVPGQGPFAPHRLDRWILTTMGPSDSARRPLRRLWLPAPGCPAVLARTPPRVSQVPDGSVCTRCLLSPRGVRSVRLVASSRTMLASPLFGGLATPI